MYQIFTKYYYNQCFIVTKILQRNEFRNYQLYLNFTDHRSAMSQQAITLSLQTSPKHEWIDLNEKNKQTNNDVPKRRKRTFRRLLMKATHFR